MCMTGDIKVKRRGNIVLMDDKRKPAFQVDQVVRFLTHQDQAVIRQLRYGFTDSIQSSLFNDVSLI